MAAPLMFFLTEKPGEALPHRVTLQQGFKSKPQLIAAFLTKSDAIAYVQAFSEANSEKA